MIYPLQITELLINKLLQQPIYFSLVSINNNLDSEIVSKTHIDKDLGIDRSEFFFFFYL